MSALRTYLKTMMPDAVISSVRGLRQSLSGPPLEREKLKSIQMVADTSERRRLNLVLPSASRKTAFGGIMTAVDVFEQLGARLASTHDAELRLICEAPAPGDGPVVDTSKVDLWSLHDNGWRLPTRGGDVFILFNWWIALNMEPLLAEQAQHFGIPARPKIYLIQEYEPQFYPFSATHMLALQAFNSDWPIWGVFNSHELFQYYKDHGNRSDRSYPFEPRLTAKMRPFADDLSAAKKARTLLVYGRPQIARNCFSVVHMGLEQWAKAHGAGHKDWRIVSAGQAHKDIPLGPHHKLESLGKLSLEGYGALLRETGVGLSLMSSPHPSYPPLEMAHFGVRVISNSYPGKDLTKRHESIHSLNDVRPAAIAEAIEQEIAAFEADPSAALGNKTFMPEFLSDTPFECMDPLARDIAALWEGRAPGD